MDGKESAVVTSLNDALICLSVLELLRPKDQYTLDTDDYDKHIRFLSLLG